MSRADKFILFVLFLYGSMNFCCVVLAKEDVLKQEEIIQYQDVTPEVIVNRPPVEYKSTGLRDPFQTYIIREKKVNAQANAALNPTGPQTNFSELIVQGIIWGTKIPQAIINNKVYIIGDKIDDAEIISIDNKGVSLSCAAGIVSLAAPGLGSVSNEVSQDNTQDNANQANNLNDASQSNNLNNASQVSYFNKAR